MGESHRATARPAHAPRRGKAATPGGRRLLRRLSRVLRGCRPECQARRPHSDTAPQPHRIRGIGAGTHRSRRRSATDSADRDRGRGLRQHRAGARNLTILYGAVLVRGAAPRAACHWRTCAKAHQHQLSLGRWNAAVAHGQPARTPRRVSPGHPGRYELHARLPGRWGIPVQCAGRRCGPVSAGRRD